MIFVVFCRLSGYPFAVPRVKGFQTALIASCASLIFSVLGCGAGSTTLPATTSNSITGNWLLTGALPFLGPNQFTNRNFGVTMTFSTVGDQIVGGGYFQVPCPSSGTLSADIGGGIVVSGVADTKGSFTAQTSATQPSGLATLQLQGSAPSSSASSWSGTYTFSSNNSGCPFNSSGPFSAARIADVTGTYTGSASLYPNGGLSSGSGQPISLTFTLQQQQTTAQIPAVNGGVLAGTVQVQGSPCFTSGTIIPAQPQLEGNVLGSHLLATFTMNDGSRLDLPSDIEDVTSGKLEVIGAAIVGGKCDGQATGPFELSRQ